MTDSNLSSHDLYVAMRDHHAADRRVEALEDARAAWDRRPDGEPLIGDDLAELGESWRFAMLAATRDGERSERLVWRVRALSAFVRSGCRNGAAMLCLPSFFDGVKEGATTEELVAILDAMASLADPEDVGPEPSSVVISSAGEKKGYFLTEQGKGSADPAERDRLFSEALDAYASAAAVEEFARRQVKIEAATTSTLYLRARVESSAEVGGTDREVAIRRLEAVVERIERQNIAATDVRDIGRRNLEVMRQDGANLEPYEIT